MHWSRDVKVLLKIICIVPEFGGPIIVKFVSHWILQPVLWAASTNTQTKGTWNIGRAQYVRNKSKDDVLVHFPLRKEKKKCYKVDMASVCAFLEIFSKLSDRQAFFGTDWYPWRGTQIINLNSL
jgi:hypothetical protein